MSDLAPRERTPAERAAPARPPRVLAMSRFTAAVRAAGELLAAGVCVPTGNVLAQPGQRDGHDAAAHVRAADHHAGRPVDVLLVRAAPPRPRLLEGHAAQGSHSIQVDPTALAGRRVELAEADLVGSGGEAARHDPAGPARLQRLR